MATPKFIKVVEDFTCGHCGTQVSGNGFTNHCPKCLWSKHVDVNPGDRAANCGGMMSPVSVAQTSGEYSIMHRCVKCGHEKNNKALPEDNFEIIVELARSSG